MKDLLTRIKMEIRLKQKEKRLAQNDNEYHYYKGQVDTLLWLLFLIKYLGEGNEQDISK